MNFLFIYFFISWFKCFCSVIKLHVEIVLITYTMFVYCIIKSSKRILLLLFEIELDIKWLCILFFQKVELFVCNSKNIYEGVCSLACILAWQIAIMLWGFLLFNYNKSVQKVLFISKYLLWVHNKNTFWFIIAIYYNLNFDI